jgi:anti-sigma B factor antagonist
MMKEVTGRLAETSIPSRAGAASARSGRVGFRRSIPPTNLGPTLGIGSGTGAQVDVGRPSGGIGEVMSAFTTRVESDVLIVKFETPAGLNDFRNNALRDALYDLVQNRPDPVLAVDLQKVDYLSSSGVAILVGLKRRVDTRKGKIVFFHVQPVVRDLLAVMKLDRFFNIADDESQALASLRPLPTA